MSADQIAAVAAFGSAVGSALTMVWYRRSERKRSDVECERRIAALKEGLSLGEDHVDRGGEPAPRRRLRLRRQPGPEWRVPGDGDDDGERRNG